MYLIGDEKAMANRQVLVSSLNERADIADAEGTATATSDAWYFRTAAAEIGKLHDALSSLVSACRRYDEHPDETIAHAVYASAVRKATEALNDG